MRDFRRLQVWACSHQLTPRVYEACELQYHLLLTRALGLLDPPTQARLDGDVAEVKRRLTPLLQKLTADS